MFGGFSAQIYLLRKNMIYVEYEKEYNYPHDKETLGFDRSGFQHTHRDVLQEINEKYNILCPQVFVMECLAPENTDKKSDEELKKDKKSLREKLELIEHPIILTGNTNTSPLIDIPLGSEYFSILTSEQIAKNCITSTPITMRRVEMDKLISHYEPRIDVFKNYVRSQTKACERQKNEMTPSQIISRAQRFARQNGLSWSKKEIKKVMRRNEQTHVMNIPNYLVKMILVAMKKEPIFDNVNRLSTSLSLTDQETQILYNQIQDGKVLTVENYPNIAYPIYLFFLFRYIVHGRQFNTIHLDQSYVRDFRYLHYLNFCDIFVSNEKSTPYIVNSLPYSDIRETPVITAIELKEKLA